VPFLIDNYATQSKVLLGPIGRQLTVDRFVKATNKGFTYQVADTVGPTKFPAAHNAPTPCGSLVQSDGAAFSVLVPYTCGKVVRVKQ
jgi:hypothetical protein